MSVSYGRYVVRENIKIFTIITLIVIALLLMMLSVFTPETIKSLEAMGDSRAVGELPQSLTLTGFLGSFYKVYAIFIPTIYSIVVGNRLLADKIDRGTMAGFLSTPITRREITITSALYFIISHVAMWTIIGGVGCYLLISCNQESLTLQHLLGSTSAFLPTIYCSPGFVLRPQESLTSRVILCLLELDWVWLSLF